MSGITAILAGGASSAVLDTQTITRGTTSITGEWAIDYYDGYSSAVPVGSIADGTSNLYSGATIASLYFYEILAPGVLHRSIVLTISSVVSNSGWAEMRIGGYSYLRTEANFTTGIGYSQWKWSLEIPDPYVSGELSPFTTTTVATWV